MVGHVIVGNGYLKIKLNAYSSISLFIKYQVYMGLKSGLIS